MVLKLLITHHIPVSVAAGPDPWPTHDSSLQIPVGAWERLWSRLAGATDQSEYHKVHRSLPGHFPRQQQ